MFAAHTEATSRLDTLQAKRDSVAAAIEFGRPDPLDDAAVAKFVAKKQQLTLLDNELAKARAAFNLADFEARIQRAAGWAAVALRGAIMPVRDAKVAEIIELLLPYCENEARARHLALSTDAVAAMSNRLSLLRLDTSNDADVSEWLDRTLNGDVTWLLWRGEE